MAKDPYRYFRIEARELAEALGRGVLALEKGADRREAVTQLLRDTHTLKGAARVVKQVRIAEATHRLESLLGAHRDGGSSPSADEVEQLLGLVDEVSAALADLGGGEELRPAGTELVAAPRDRQHDLLDGDRPVGVEPPAVTTQESDRAAARERTGGAPAGEGVAAAPVETVRVEIDEIDQLLVGLSESSIQLGTLAQEIGSLRATRRRVQDLAAVAGDEIARTLEEIAVAIDRVERRLDRVSDRAVQELDAARERAGRLRLVPAETIFGSLEREVRDVAIRLGKSVVFSALGGEQRLDGHALAAIRDALLHVVRNAVDHGIEPEPERRAAGKPPSGRVQITVERRGHRIAVRCEDDGRGIDVEAVRRAAVAGGHVPSAEARALDAEQVRRLIFQQGLSTAAQVSEISGRGVGLDVVKAVAARSQGDVSVTSVPGRSTTFEITVPVSLLSVAALEVEAGGLVAAVPLASIRRTLRIPEREVQRAPAGDSIVVDGRILPFASLAAVLEAPSDAGDGRAMHTVVVLAEGHESVAIGVDRVRSARDLFVRRLPALVGTLPLYAGLSFDAEGDPRPVMDAGELARAVRRTRSRAVEPTATRRLPLLVIDDSLTTRMLEQSILESAGYEVELAVDAEEGLAKARARRYGLFVCDVEMPGMSGYDFVALARSDPQLKDVPAILVTSRGAPEDLRRGAAAGARGYIVKGEFDQVRLLALVRQLLG